MELQAGVKLICVKNVQDHGELKDLEGEFKLHPQATDKGGIYMKDEAHIVPAAIKDITSQIASNLVKGQVKDISQTPAPAYLHHHFSQLCLWKNDQSFCKYIQKAVECDDPVERLKLLVTYMIPPFFINPTLIQCRVPLNPILGETLQADMETGEKLYVEKISHKPPIIAFQLEGKDASYTLDGHFTIKGWLNGPNSLAGTKEGKTTLTFKDGTVYTFTNPYLIIHNLIAGSQYQTYVDTATITDEKNKLQATIRYNPWGDNSYKSMIKNGVGKLFGFGKKKQQASEPIQRADDIHVEICQLSDNEQKKKKEEKIVLSSGTGNWLSHLVIDGQPMWRIEEDVPQIDSESKVLRDGTKRLPSDMDYREDIPPMIQKDWKTAEELKQQMEQLQRDDRKLREDAAKRKKGK